MYQKLLQRVVRHPPVIVVCFSDSSKPAVSAREALEWTRQNRYSFLQVSTTSFGIPTLKKMLLETAVAKKFTRHGLHCDLPN